MTLSCACGHCEARSETGVTCCRGAEVVPSWAAALFAGLLGMLLFVPELQAGWILLAV